MPFCLHERLLTEVEHTGFYAALASVLLRLVASFSYQGKHAIVVENVSLSFIHATNNISAAVTSPEYFQAPLPHVAAVLLICLWHHL